ncbi:hypothetical protein ACFVFJ_00815 [Streptomyces sp. NPDC057717]|uniref:hypothetical protein n=1 Tax=Streptomyces sp. NPDC057717 TaxID=3346224 RepID=UPI00368DBEB4
MDLEDVGQLPAIKYLIRDRDAKYPQVIDDILDQAGITTTLTGIRIPRMNSIMERWVRTLRRELLDRTLIWNERHLRHALNEYEEHAPPEPLDPEQIDRLSIRRHDRLSDVIHEYRHAC